MPDTSPTPLDGFDQTLDLLVLVTDSLRDYMATLPGQNWSAEDAPDLALHVVNELDDKGLLRSRASIGPDSESSTDDLPGVEWLTPLLTEVSAAIYGGGNLAALRNTVQGVPPEYLEAAGLLWALSSFDDKAPTAEQIRKARELEAEKNDLNAIEARYVETLSSDEWCDNNRELEAARSSAHDVPHLLAELRNLRLRRAAGLLPGPDEIVVSRDALNSALDCCARASACGATLRAALSQPQPKPEETS